MSPRLLHLGYELERVFAGNAAQYELLAGGGKRSAYKQGLAPVSDIFRSLQFVKNPLLGMMYRIYDAMKP